MMLEEPHHNRIYTDEYIYILYVMVYQTDTDYDMYPFLHFVVISYRRI